MFFANYARVCVLLALATGGATAYARANITDYEFRLVETQVKTGQPIVAVRLIHKPDDRLISDAVIFATRLDMAPDNMESMTRAIEPVQSLEPGIYQFKVDLTDEGRWRLSLAAKVQGETGTLQNHLVLKAIP